MRQTRVPPNVTRSMELRGAQRSYELAFRSRDFCVPENLIFPALRYFDSSMAFLNLSSLLSLLHLRQASLLFYPLLICFLEMFHNGMIQHFSQSLTIQTYPC